MKRSVCRQKLAVLLALCFVASANVSKNFAAEQQELPSPPSSADTEAQSSSPSTDNKSSSRSRKERRRRVHLELVDLSPKEPPLGYLGPTQDTVGPDEEPRAKVTALSASAEAQAVQPQQTSSWDDTTLVVITVVGGLMLLGLLISFARLRPPVSKEANIAQ